MSDNFEIKKNMLVLRGDTLNNWKWTNEIQKQLEEIKLEQKAILEMIKKNEELFGTIIELVAKEDFIPCSGIINNTNV